MSKSSAIRVLLFVFLLLFVAAATMGSGVVTRKDAASAVILDDDLVTGSVTVTDTSAQYTLPDVRDPYVVCAIGTSVYVECGSAPTVTTSAGGYTFVIPESVCLGPMVLKGPKCAHIATATVTGAAVVFMHFDPSL